ncbi:MAG: hypothetical protein O4859_03345, partial [Trichodesmium sp. St18_bin1]|nr:hypothetical protein [Trichodesmium sp. St18_bin1]
PRRVDISQAAATLAVVLSWSTCPFTARHSINYYKLFVFNLTPKRSLPRQKTNYWPQEKGKILYC